MKGKKTTSEEARKDFLDKNIIMIGEFKLVNEPVLCKCNCGEFFYAKLYNIRAGSFSCCPACSQSKKANNIEKVKEICKQNNFVYVRGYKNTKTKIEVICSCGKTRFISLDNIKKGRNCGCVKRTKERHHMWRPDRENLMEERKFKKACYSMLTRCMNRKNNKSNTEELLGYTSEQLQNHIKNHPDYSKAIETGLRLSIDHIIPLQAFKDHNMLNENYVWLINHLDNLRPSVGSWNSTKHSFYLEGDFINYLNKMNVSYPHTSNTTNRPSGTKSTISTTCGKLLVT